MKPKFKLGDKVKFSRVAYREMTLLAAENDPKPWYDAKWVGVEPKRTIVSPVIPSRRAVVPIGEQEGIYVGTRTKKNGILVYDNSPDEELRWQAKFKRLSSVPCGLVVTDVRKNPILVLIEDLEHV
jgi:hypothetical protein